MLKVEKVNCNGDGVCSDICPVAAIVLNKDEGKAEIDPDSCIECYSCMNACPHDAIYEDD